MTCRKERSRRRQNDGVFTAMCVLHFDFYALLVTGFLFGFLFYFVVDLLFVADRDDGDVAVIASVVELGGELCRVDEDADGGDDEDENETDYNKYWL